MTAGVEAMYFSAAAPRLDWPAVRSWACVRCVGMGVSG